jgi:cell division protein FtsI (penicillin-binding protein 3)
MEAVITEGTGRVAFKNMPFAIAGKTGTAHVADGKIKYDDMVYQASFVGYFPADKPQYTCIVVIRTKPHEVAHFGGLLAAPVFREIATKLYAMYVETKKPVLYTVVKDSSAYFYAGYTNDLKKVYGTLNAGYKDSAQLNNWSNMYGGNYSKNNSGEPVLRSNIARQQTMPNVKGMGLKDALYLLENMGMKVSIKGKGKIINQSVAPGTSLGKGVTVMLELS